MTDLEVFDFDKDSTFLNDPEPHHPSSLHDIK